MTRWRGGEMAGWRDDEVVKVAQAMTAVEPPADLEARIKARLDASVADRRPSFVWRLAVPLAAAAAVAIVTLVVQGPGSKVQGPGSAISSSRQLETSPSRHLETSPSGHLAISSPRHLATSPSRHLETSPFEEWLARRIPALEPIEALAVDRLSLDSIQPEPLAITPLDVTPLGASPTVGDTDTGRQQYD